MFQGRIFPRSEFLFTFYVLLRLCDYHHLYWLLIERWYLRAESKYKSNPANESIISPEPVTLTRLLYCSVWQSLQGAGVSCAKAMRGPQRPSSSLCSIHICERKLVTSKWAGRKLWHAAFSLYQRSLVFSSGLKILAALILVYCQNLFLHGCWPNSLTWLMLLKSALFPSKTTIEQHYSF